MSGFPTQREMHISMSDDNVATLTTDATTRNVPPTQCSRCDILQVMLNNHVMLTMQNAILYDNGKVAMTNVGNTQCHVQPYHQCVRVPANPLARCNNCSMTSSASIRTRRPARRTHHCVWRRQPYLLELPLPL